MAYIQTFSHRVTLPHFKMSANLNCWRASDGGVAADEHGTADHDDALGLIREHYYRHTRTEKVCLVHTVSQCQRGSAALRQRIATSEPSAVVFGGLGSC